MCFATDSTGKLKIYGHNHINILMDSNSWNCPYVWLYIHGTINIKFVDKSQNIKTIIYHKVNDKGVNAHSLILWEIL